ncbi:MAG: TrmH family RNA methyltransferase [Bdellovibrionota bacterium]
MERYESQGQFRKRKRRELHRAEKRFERHKRVNLLASPGKHQSILILDNLKPDYNIGKIFRSADAFGVKELHLIGVDYFDPSPAVGSFKWVPAKFQNSFDDVYFDLDNRGWTLFALEPYGGELITNGNLPEKSAFILGHEQFGLSFKISDYPKIRPLTIPQFGKVQSLNVSVAASIVLYEYARQFGSPEVSNTNFEFVADDRSPDLPKA